jgi:hypothetical protein
MSMNSWKDRVEIERKQLAEKLEKLDAFIDGSDKFVELAYEERMLLCMQRHAMQTYRDILDLRIARFGVKA